MTMMTTTMMPSLSLSISPSLSLLPSLPPLWGRRAQRRGGGGATKAEEEEAVPSLSFDVAVYRGDEVKGLVLIDASKLRGAAARWRQKLSQETEEREGSGGGGGDPPPSRGSYQLS